MPSSPAREVFIQGVTRDGRTFRPSDWAERLAGVMSSFRPGGAQPGSHLNYSPWCIPTVIEGVKCVIVNRELRDYEPMAWDFVINFAKDKISTALPELWLYVQGLLFILVVTALPKGIAGEFDGESRFAPSKVGDMFARWRGGKAAA